MPRILPRGGFSGTALKRLALVCMLLDHIGAVCLWRGVILPWPGIGQGINALCAADPAFAAWYWFYYALRLVGRLAFPLYCFLLAEGFAHTRSTARYAARLGLFALASELPFDLAVTGQLCSNAAQNVYFTLFWGLCGLWGLQRLQRLAPGRTLLPFAAPVLCAVAAELLHTDYGAAGVALITVFGVFRGQTTARDLLAVVLTAEQMTAPLAILPIRAYTGSRGRQSRAEQWAHYLFYPAHLLALALLTERFLL